MPNLNYNTRKLNVRYYLEDSDIECYVLTSGKPTKCRLLVNHKWRRAGLVASKGASVLFEYDGDSGASCYQEWIAEPNGSYRKVRSFGSRLSATWRNEL